MKRHLLFAWNSDERAGGWADFIDSFDSANEALHHYTTHVKVLSKDLFDIVDTQSGVRGEVLNPEMIRSWYGYESDEPCLICGGHYKNQSEPRFGYTLCHTHHRATIKEINACREKRKLR